MSNRRAGTVDGHIPQILSRTYLGPHAITPSDDMSRGASATVGDGEDKRPSVVDGPLEGRELKQSRIARKLVRAGVLDVKIALRHTVLNTIAGSVWTPRPIRASIYRACGMSTASMNIFAGVSITGTDVAIGAGTFINHNCRLDAALGRIEIGENCHLGPEVMILTATHCTDEAGRAVASSTYLTTRLGDHVWLGARSVVLPGVSIGSNCVIAAGAVVAQDCLADGIYGGVPARRLEKR